MTQQAPPAQIVQPTESVDPIAVVQGKQITDVPKDLYIPPDALEIFLEEVFSGPLDLLLYLIKKQNLDILDIPIAKITAQYMQYVEVMKEMHLELAAEYLVMAAMLAEIKSRLLLPRPESIDDEEADPRAELVRRLQEYERFKQAAEDIDVLPRQGRDTFASTPIPLPELEQTKPEPMIELPELLLALREVLRRAEHFNSHAVHREILSVRERMTVILSILKQENFTDFVALFTVEEGRMGVVVTFLAVLELIKSTLIEVVQNDAYGPIHVRAITV